MNSIIIKGRLTRDPEMRTTQSGKSVTDFSVAVDRRIQKDKTDFFDVTAWEKTGEFVNKYFRKGKEILVQGEMQRREYTDKSGNKRYAWNLIAQNVEFCGSKSDDQTSPAQAARTVPSGQSYPAAGAAPNIGADEARRQRPACTSGPNNSNFEEVPSDDDDLPF